MSTDPELDKKIMDLSRQITSKFRIVRRLDQGFHDLLFYGMENDVSDEFAEKLLKQLDKIAIRAEKIHGIIDQEIK